MDARLVVATARAGRLAGVALLLGLAAIGLAGCIGIIEGCTYPYETGASAEIPFVLDAEHPVATSTIEVALTKDALPGDVEERGARLKLTLVDAPEVTLTLVPEETGTPLPLIAARGEVSLPLDQCLPDQPCATRMLAIVEWLHPEAAPSKPATLTVEGLVQVPHTDEHCGLPANVVSVTATPPAPRPPAARAGAGEARHEGAELVQHVTVRLEDGLPTGDGGASGDAPLVTRGHLGITPDPDPPAPGPGATLVTGIWLRMTPDGGGPPVLDGPMSRGFTTPPADATFPIDASCARPCERGYWIQAAAYDPAGHTSIDPAKAVFGWTFDASVSSTGAPGGSDVGIAVTLDAPAGREPPPLVLHGTGAPFRLDSSHPATTLAIDASVPARPGLSFGDPIADVPVVFRLTTVAVDPGLPGQLWLSNGHYLGDGTTGDDAADTGATGGPATVTSPAGRPLRACEGVTDACDARTGLVLRRYKSSFDNVDTPPFDVQWEWSVVGAPPGATVTVQPLDGETLDAGIGAVPPWPVVVGVLVAGVLVLGLGVVGVRSRRRGAGAGPGSEP